MADLQMKEHLAYHRRYWAAQRVVWVLLLVLLVAAGLGLLGGQGPLHSATAGRGTELEVRYPRVQRLESELHLEFRTVSSDEATVLVFPSSFFLDHRVEAWSPEPGRAQVIGDESRFEFGSADRIFLHATVLTIGRKSATIRTGAGAGARMGYLVLP